jgi:hypothetical protein
VVFREEMNMEEIFARIEKNIDKLTKVIYKLEKETNIDVDIEMDLHFEDTKPFYAWHIHTFIK